MDSQLSSHGHAYAYSSTHYPEFYDLWVAEIIGSGANADAAIFASYFTPLLERPPVSVTVVDVGTGTGRVIKNLYKALAHHPIDADATVRFYGFDNSATMLERAETTFNIDVAAAVVVPENIRVEASWKVASAGAWVGELGLQIGEVDLVTFAAGTIGHLTEQQELMSFLREVAKALAPATGRAVISVITDMTTEKQHAKRHGHGHDRGHGAKEREVEFEKPMTIRSHETAGLAYVKTPTEKKVVGDLVTESFEVKGVSVKDDGTVNESDVLWRQQLKWSLRFFDDKRFRHDVDKAGLLVEKVEEPADGFQKWYILKVKPVMGE